MLTVVLVTWLAQACTIPDPFTAIGGGSCVNGGWVPKPPPPPAPIEEVIVQFPPASAVSPIKGRLYSGIITPAGRPCDGQMRGYAWFNNYGFPIYVTGISIWNGVDVPGVVDLTTQVFISPSDPPMPIWSHNWDRYAPTAWHEPFKATFAPFYYEVSANGWITFNIRCANVQGSASAAAQLLVRFTVVRP